MAECSSRRLWAVTVAVLCGLVLWDVGGQDLPMARWFGSAQGFPWRSAHALVLWGHEVPRTLSSLCLAALLVAAVRPFGAFKAWAKADRWQLVLSILAAMLVISLLKQSSHTSCPWDLREFGGVAQYVSHWNWGSRDGGGGHCFPGGHASAAMAYLAGWFVVRRVAPRYSVLWLAGALLAGLALGWVQQVRGAHYLSHTLWSGWLCWTTGLAIDTVLATLRGRRFVDTNMNIR